MLRATRKESKKRARKLEQAFSQTSLTRFSVQSRETKENILVLRITTADVQITIFVINPEI